MSIFDLELPGKDLHHLEDQLRARVDLLSDAARKTYFDQMKVRIRDPDTYAVLGWSLGLGLHHVYLRRWWSFLLDLVTSIVFYGGLIAWFITGALSFPILTILAFLYNTFDTLYCVILSQRIVQYHNLRLGLAMVTDLSQNGAATDATRQPILDSRELKQVSRTNSTLFLISLAGMAVLCLAVWLFFAKGLPLLARYAAFALPEKTFMIQNRQQAAEAIDRLEAFAPSQLDGATEQRLQRLFSRMEHHTGQKEPYHLFLRHGGSLGANAFAFPTGMVVITDELVNLAQNDEELLAIMAHEWGHLQQRHGIRTFFQDSASLLIVSMVTGDLVSLAGAVGTTMHFVLHATHSQEFEMEADQTTVRYFHDNAIPIAHFANILRALTRDQKPGTGTTVPFLASHPPPQQRIQLLQANEKPATL
ncbi:MAG: M48 family metallopeptidase [Magnetococcales bacterium]|nr:M48 family metallopeptidase [Magnetococcales bacterium]MBF0148607.1 M48 family metallopeptidase [Magnetococcales bacterium]